MQWQTDATVVGEIDDTLTVTGSPASSPGAAITTAWVLAAIRVHVGDDGIHPAADAGGTV